MLNKIFEKCPVGWVIVRSCRLFISSFLATNTVESNKKKLSKLLWVKSDKCLSQLSDFMPEEVNTNGDPFTSFNKENDRFDTYYFCTVNIGKYKELSMILKTILTLCHGNASVECGFSINKNLEDVNMNQESIIALNVWLKIIWLPTTLLLARPKFQNKY